MPSKCGQLHASLLTKFLGISKNDRLNYTFYGFLEKQKQMFSKCPKTKKKQKAKPIYLRPNAQQDSLWPTTTY